MRPLDASGAEQVKAEISRWYEAPGRWRREVASTVIGSDGRPVSRNGLTTVSDGSAVWLYRARDNSVMVQPYGHAAGSDELGPFPEVTGGLSDLLVRANACYAPRLTGSDRVVLQLQGSGTPGAQRHDVRTPQPHQPPQRSLLHHPTRGCRALGAHPTRGVSGACSSCAGPGEGDEEVEGD